MVRVYILCITLTLFITVKSNGQSTDSLNISGIKHNNAIDSVKTAGIETSKLHLLDSNSVYNIDQVVVSANKARKEMSPVQILSGKTLQNLSVYSVADALRYFSGVQVKDYGGIGGLKTVNVRSMGSHHVGVFYDGVEIDNAQNGVVDLGRFSLDNMEAISLYNGQKSGILQTAKDYSSASAIYMQTKMPKFSKGKKTNLNFGLKGGSFETVNPSILWEQKLSDSMSLSFSTEYMYTSGRYKFSYSKKDGYDTTEVRQNGDVNMFRAESSVFGKVNNGEWKAKVYYYKSARGYPGASVREEPGKFIHQDRQWDDNLFAQGSYRKKFSSLYSLLVNGKYSYDALHYVSDPRKDVSTMYVDNRYYQREAYISTGHLFAINDKIALSLSNDLIRNVLNSDMTDFVYPTRNTILTALAGYFEIGSVKIQGNILHTYVNDKTEKTSAQAGDKSIFTPSTTVSWKPIKDEDLSIRAFYKKIFRMPTLNDLYYTFIGNSSLKPEYTTQYDVGLVYSKSWDHSFIRGLEFQVDGYYNQVEDKIIAMPTSNQFRWTMMNLGFVEIKGVDVSFQGNFHISNSVLLNTRLNYTYQKAQDFTDSSSEWYGGQIPYVPWHSGSAVVNLDIKGWNLNYSFIYTGERYESVANIDVNYAPAWYTSDFAVSKEFSFPKFRFRTTAEVNNILNQQYEVVKCYPMPGINFKIKLNFIL